MTKEELILRGVVSTLIGKEFVICVESLKEHFDDATFHETDVLETEDGKFIKPKDVCFGIDRSHAMTAEAIHVTVTEELLESNPKPKEHDVQVGDKVAFDNGVTIDPKLDAVKEVNFTSDKIEKVNEVVSKIEAPVGKPKKAAKKKATKE